MGFLDVVFGRKRLKEAADERLFALSTAQVTLQVELGLKTAGAAAVVFKPLSAGEFMRAENEMQALLDAVAQASGSRIEQRTDELGFEWLMLEDPDLEDLVTTAHPIGAEMKARGFGPAARRRFHPPAARRRSTGSTATSAAPAGRSSRPATASERNNAEELELKTSSSRSCRSSRT